MTEFKVGDRIKVNGYPNTWIVMMIDDGEAWCKNEKSGAHLTFSLSILKKVPDFFEAGKTYRSKAMQTSTFECHYVGWIGGASTGHKYAAGQYNGQSLCSQTVRIEDDFKYWTEI